jgi:hypothetical protein
MSALGQGREDPSPWPSPHFVGRGDLEFAHAHFVGRGDLEFAHAHFVGRGDLELVS